MNTQRYSKLYEASRAERAEHATWPHGDKNTLPELEKQKEPEGKMAVKKVKHGTIIKLY